MAQGLGRGLGSLIPQKRKEFDSEDNYSPQILDEKDRVIKVDPEKIIPNPYQPRKDFSQDSIDELVQSIKEHGIIQPLIVSREADHYELIAGERRLRASKQAGLLEVPVIVRDIDKQKKLEVALIENVQRQDLNPLETALAYQRLIDEFNITQTDLSKRIGKPRSSVANTLRLLNLPTEIREALYKGQITEAHAKYLLGLDSEAKQLSIFKKIIHNNLSVRDTNKEVRRIGGTKSAKIPINYADKDKEESLRQTLGTKVEIVRKGVGGSIVIDFYSDGELDQIIEKIQ